MSRKILVTGGSGFIGTYIMRDLASRGDRVVNFDIRQPGPAGTFLLGNLSREIAFEEGTIEDWAAVVRVIEKYRPQSVIHIAAIVNPVLLNKQPRLALNVNLGGTYNILEAARIFDLGRIIHFSSIGVLPGLKYQPVDVDHPVFLRSEGPGTNFYGAAKVAEEAFCWAFRQSFQVDCISLRPSAVYGFGMQWPMFIKPMVENSLLGLPTRFDHGRDFPRDYTHVADVAQLAVKSLDIPRDLVKDRVFFAATGQPLVTAGQVAGLVKEFIPEADIEIGPGLSEADKLEIRYRGILDIQNAVEQLGYQPRYCSIRDGIQEYIETFRTFKAAH
jgi:UDP-glucose 4-epimerase